MGGVETAFRATIETGEGPTVAILCEYDALPGIGHACGHNVIATSGAGAGAALAAVQDQLPKGRIQVIGTPAEEGGGGKIKLIKAGVFKDVDAAMMIHGFDRTLLHQDLLGIARATFEFSGKASHASADPWEGVNALDAASRRTTPSACCASRCVPTAGSTASSRAAGRRPTSSPSTRRRSSTSALQASTRCGISTGGSSPAPRARPRPPAASSR